MLLLSLCPSCFPFDFLWWKPYFGICFSNLYRCNARICSSPNSLWDIPWGASRFKSSHSCFCERAQWGINQCVNGWNMAQNPCSRSLPFHPHHHHSCGWHHSLLWTSQQSELGVTSPQEHPSLSHKVGSWERHQSLSCFLFWLFGQELWEVCEAYTRVSPGHQLYLLCEPTSKGLAFLSWNPSTGVFSLRNP